MSDEIDDEMRALRAQSGMTISDRIGRAYYERGGIKAIDVIEAFELNFSRGCAVKYILRAGHKNDELEDLENALYYIDREVVHMRKAKR